ncbi:MAG: pyridoxal-phosphate dependent enzyme [Bdellovibrionales bacterium]
MIVENMTDLIGDTPLLKIPAEVTGLKNVDLYGKLEMLNPFGSVKDRVAWAMLKDDLKDIKEKDQTIFENSSGNTAKAIAAICGIYNIPFKQVSAMMKVQEGRDVLHWLGAELEEFAAASDCFDPSDPNDPQFLIEKAVRESGGKVYFTSQFTNEKNPEIHEKTTAQEILNDLGAVDYLISGLGTTGSTLGLIRAFKKAKSDFQAVGLVTKSGNMVPGIRSLDQMWESGLYNEGKYEYHHVIDERQALEAMQELNTKLGLLCGPSAGANYAGAVSYLKTIDDQLTERKKAVFIVCDRMEWYLSYVKERMPELFGEKSKPDSLFNFEYDENQINQIEGEGVASFINDNDPLIVDVRSPIAYELNSVQGAINIPIDTFEKLIDSAKPFPTQKPVLLICAVGEKTKRHAAYLRKQGYDAYSVQGGMLGIKQAEAKSDYKLAS